MAQGDITSAMRTFKRVVEVDPKFTRAWLELGVVYMNQRQTDAAIDAFRKAVDADPKELVARKMYASWLTYLRRDEAALQAWHDVLQLAPDDRDANSSTANLLVQNKRYTDALPYLEALAKSDKSTGPQIRLGSAYLNAGQTEKGTAILEKLLETDSKAETFNDVAYELAEANADLPRALEYAQRAVDEQEKQSHDVELPTLLQEDLECTRAIGSFWDTLGWVQFRLGHYDQAEMYLHAAWVLSEEGIVADHLGQVYEREKQPEKAIHMYRLAVAAPDSGGLAKDVVRQRLDHLGVKAPTSPLDAFRDRSGDELSQLRSVKLKRLIPGSATAEFFLLFGPGPKLEDVAFVSGSEKLKSAGDVLYDTKFQVAFPTVSSARLVRRAIVMCSPVSGCEAVLYTPNSVRSVN
jgi:tetratricopeptide (TPR) repeat protein